MLLFAFLPSSSASPMKAGSVPPPHHPTSIIVRLLLLAQNRCCKAHRDLQGGDCFSHYANEKKLQELTPATLPRGGQKPRLSLLTLNPPCWAT